MLRSLFRAFIINLDFLLLKLMNLFIRVLPCRAFFIDFYGAVIGLINMCLKFRQWGPILRFARNSGSTIPSWKYLLKYYIYEGIDRYWTNALFDNMQLLSKHISIENKELLENIARSGRGAIFLASHTGTRLQAYLLHRLGIPLKHMASQKNFSKWRDGMRYGIRPLVSGRIKYYSDPARCFVPGRSEKALVKSLKEGGSVLMLIDVIIQGERDRNVDFFGIKFPSNNFPFRLSLNYKIPVFFCFFEKIPNRYRLHVRQCEDFSTPEEGFLRYASFFHDKMLSHTYKWSMIPYLRDDDLHVSTSSSDRP